MKIEGNICKEIKKKFRKWKWYEVKKDTSLQKQKVMKCILIL